MIASVCATPCGQHIVPGRAALGTEHEDSLTNLTENKTQLFVPSIQHKTQAIDPIVKSVPVVTGDCSPGEATRLLSNQRRYCVKWRFATSRRARIEVSLEGQSHQTNRRICLFFPFPVIIFWGGVMVVVIRRGCSRYVAREDL